MGLCGDNQFAYLPGRGCRDALLFMALSWLSAWARGHKILLYCSDVSGAFDRVSASRLLWELRLAG
eukprot:1297731-Karenia_brevis.AAC.1